MQTKTTNIVKRIVDVVLTVLLLFLMAYQVTGDVLHEWLGIGMTVTLILHHILNRKWYKAVFKGKYSPYRITMTAVNTLMLISIALTALSGMSMSGHAVPFMYGFINVMTARTLHLVMSYSFYHFIVVIIRKKHWYSSIYGRTFFHSFSTLAMKNMRKHEKICRIIRKYSFLFMLCQNEL
jgi:hypothetical protein